MLSEMESLRAAGVRIEENLLVSDRAHVILPTHALLDGAREKALGRRDTSGTTSRGIGPAYETKANRTGVRMADLVDADRFREIRAARPRAPQRGPLPFLRRRRDPPSRRTLDTYVECGKKLARFVTDTSAWLNAQLASGKEAPLRRRPGSHAPTSTTGRTRS